MTREEVDSMLRRSITEAGEVTKNLFAPQETRVLGACVAGLVLVLADLDRRLRALEPCSRGPDRPHEWGHDMTKDCCVWCGVRKDGAT